MTHDIIKAAQEAGFESEVRDGILRIANEGQWREPTEEEQARIDDKLVLVKKEDSKNTLNANRDIAINSMVVTVDGNTYDGNPTSVNNIKMALLTLEDGEETPWITENNQQVSLTKNQLKAILREIGMITRTLYFECRIAKDAL